MLPTIARALKLGCGCALLLTTFFSEAADQLPNTPVKNLPKSSPSTNNANVRVEKPRAAQLAWKDLTPAQQEALSPLSSEWDKLDTNRKTKWLAIGNKYSSLKPAEQERVHERMRDWLKLTPEQRRVARENYTRAKKLNPEQKSAQWQQYQQLPEDQKKKLAADAGAKKRVAALPSASQGKNKTVPSIKSASKPVLERSITPRPADNASGSPSSAATNPQP